VRIEWFAPHLTRSEFLNGGSEVNVGVSVGNVKEGSWCLKTVGRCWAEEVYGKGCDVEGDSGRTMGNREADFLRCLYLCGLFLALN
jgi:hypothetical protein